METLWQDLRFALRTLRRQLSVTLFVAVSLALAIAGNTTVFSTINGLIYRPLPYEEPHRLALIGERSADSRRGHSFGPTSLANFLDLRERQTSFQALAAFRTTTVNLGRVDAAPEPLSAAAVTPEFFPVLGVRTVAGRTFLPEEGVPGSHGVAVVSARLWRERFASDEDAVGATLVLDGEPYDVIGLLPDDFEFLNPAIGLYVPLAPERGDLDRHARDVLGIGRLAPGVRDEAAQAELAAIMARLVEEYPEANRGYEVDALNVRHELPLSRTRQVFFLFQLGLLFVLLIACANAGNLLLARSQAREREIAIRSSLGAGRWRIARQVLTENLLLALLAGGLGLLLGRLGVELMARAMVGRFPRATAPVIDGRVLGFTLLVTLAAGLLFGLAPVVRTFRVRLLAALKDGTRATTAGGRRRLLSNALVVAEIALALVLLGGAGILLRSFQALQSTDPGFDTGNLLTVQLVLPETRYPGDAEVVTGVEQLVERLAGLPGVTGAAASNLLPRSPFTFPATYTLDARPPAGTEPPPRALWLSADPAYFATLDVPLLRGRAFTAVDRAGASLVAVVNDALARRHWGAASPLGERLTVQGRSREIVGVVATVRHGLAISDERDPAIYLPWAQQPQRQASLVLRTERDAASLTAEVRRRILAFDPGLAIARLETQDAIIAQYLVATHIYTAVLGGFGALALVLAALGTYGVLAYAVAQRTHEIGVRMALGAGRGQVMGMVVRQGLAMAVLGIALGVPGSVWAARTLAGLLANLAPITLSTVLGIALVLALAALLASWLPARRAAGVDPIRALRYE